MVDSVKKSFEEKAGHRFAWGGEKWSREIAIPGEIWVPVGVVDSSGSSSEDWASLSAGLEWEELDPGDEGGVGSDV